METTTVCVLLIIMRMMSSVAGKVNEDHILLHAGKVNEDLHDLLHLTADGVEFLVLEDIEFERHPSVLQLVGADYPERLGRLLRVLKHDCGSNARSDMEGDGAMLDGALGLGLFHSETNDISSHLERVGRSIFDSFVPVVLDEEISNHGELA